MTPLKLVTHLLSLFTAEADGVDLVGSGPNHGDEVEVVHHYRLEVEEPGSSRRELDAVALGHEKNLRVVCWLSMRQQQV